MTSPALLLVVGLLFAQTPPPANPACALLTQAQVTSLIGAAKTMPVSANPLGSSCMLMGEGAGDKIITVLIVNNKTPEGAARQFESAKAVAAGKPIAGWTLPSFVGGRGPTIVFVGFMNGLVTTEVRLSDSTQKGDGATTKLTTVLQEIAARK